MDPFRAALDAMFEAPGSDAAVYQTGAAPVFPIRVIRSAPDRFGSFGDGQIINASSTVSLRRWEITEPKRGDVVTIGATIENGAAVGGERFEVFGDPILDLERLSWTVGIEPA